MRPLRRRTRFEKVVKTARDAKLPAAVRSAVPDIAHPPKAIKSGATAAVAATAASAAISVVRRRLEGGRSDQ
jgi:hypothetical protein